MFTQCPDCSTVFRVSAESLRIAAGDVRCGVCATRFNALESLSEQAFELVGEEASAESSIAVVEVPGTEAIELSTATDLPRLDEGDIPAGDDVPQVSVSAEYPVDLDPLDDGALELDELRDIGSPRLPPAANEAASAPWDADAADDDELLDDLDSTDEFPILVLDEQDDPPVAEAFAQPRILIPDEMRRGLFGEPATTTIEDIVLETPPEPPAAPRWPWLLGLLALGLLLGAQVVHSQRESLIQHPVVGPWLMQAYALLGSPQGAPSNLAAFELRQWGATTSPEQSGRLRLRASIVNRAPFAQPFPLLRVALQDRFGNTIGAREVTPADYLPGEQATRLLAPGQRADAEISIVDPGTEAVGFEIDACLQDGAVLRCAGDGQ